MNNVFKLQRHYFLNAHSLVTPPKKLKFYGLFMAQVCFLLYVRILWLEVGVQSFGCLFDYVCLCKLWRR